MPQKEIAVFVFSAATKSLSLQLLLSLSLFLSVPLSLSVSLRFSTCFVELRFGPLWYALPTLTSTLAWSSFGAYSISLLFLLSSIINLSFLSIPFSISNYIVVVVVIDRHLFGR